MTESVVGPTPTLTARMSVVESELAYLQKLQAFNLLLAPYTGPAAVTGPVVEKLIGEHPELQAAWDEVQVLKKAMDDAQAAAYQQMLAEQGEWLVPGLVPNPDYVDPNAPAQEVVNPPNVVVGPA